MNLKKTAGGNASSAKEIANVARQDKDFLRDQLEILNPSFVVCCGKRFIFSLARELFPDAHDAVLINSEDEPKGMISGRFFRGTSLWIDYVHPSIRGYTRELKFNVLVNMVSQVL
jgi:hypothetical protein